MKLTYEEKRRLWRAFYFHNGKPVKRLRDVSDEEIKALLQTTSGVFFKLGESFKRLGRAIRSTRNG